MFYPSIPRQASTAFTFILIALLQATPGGAKPTCAVLTFDAKSAITQDEAYLLSDRFAVELSQYETYSMINRSKMMEILREQRLALSDVCSSERCAIQSGKILGVQYIIFGTAGKIGSLYTLNSFLVNVETSETEKSASIDIKGDIEELFTEGIKRNLQKLMNVRPADSNATTQAPAPETAETDSSIYKKLCTPAFWDDFNGKTVHFDAKFVAIDSLEIIYQSYQIPTANRIFINHRETFSKSGIVPGFNVSDDAMLPDFFISIEKSKSDIILQLQNGDLIHVEGVAEVKRDAHSRILHVQATKIVKK